MYSLGTWFSEKNVLSGYILFPPRTMAKLMCFVAMIILVASVEAHFAPAPAGRGKFTAFSFKCIVPKCSKALAGADSFGGEVKARPEEPDGEGRPQGRALCEALAHHSFNQPKV